MGCFDQGIVFFKNFIWWLLWFLWFSWFPLNTSRAAKRGGVGFPIWTCPSFFVLFCRDFPDLLGDGPGIFPIRPFSLSRPIKSTYEEQSRKGPRHNLVIVF